MNRNLCKRAAKGLIGVWALPRGLLAALALLATPLGCSPPRPSAEDLGQIVYEPSFVPGADQHYTLPYGLDKDAPPDAHEASQTSSGASKSAAARAE
ncbi:MAG TPA: hypothetical protein VFW87_23320 [Pirellulales bacterium]|nr:hypothetical protein [Pirellulales bacterium]